MKKIVFPSLLAVCFTGLTACLKEKPRFTAVSVLGDRTETEFADTGFVRKNLPALATLIVPDTLNPGGDGGQISVSTLNDLSQNTPRIATLAPDAGGALGPNPYLRKEDLANFQVNLAEALTVFRQASISDTRQSKIYQGLCNELTRLAAVSADRKIMVVYSDFLENSPLFTFYPLEKADFVKDPVQFTRSRLSKVCPLPNLAGIEIYLVAYRTVDNDEAVNVALRFWQTILEHAGARVKTGVDLAAMK